MRVFRRGVFARYFVTSAVFLAFVSAVGLVHGRTRKPKPPNLSLAASPFNVNEGQTGSYTINASAPAAENITVNYSMSGTAALGTHYSLSGNPGQAVIPVGATSTSVVLTASVTGLTSGSEAATMTLGKGAGYKVKTGKKAPKATVTINNVVPTPTPLPLPTSGYFLPVRGIFGNIEHRGTQSVYNPGDLLHDWDVADPTTGLAAGQEAALQFDKMREMGVNHMTMGITTSDPTYTGTFQPPDCNMPPAGGLQWPQPTDLELQNLKKLFDLAQQKGISLVLHLSNNHQEEQPPTNSQTWLGAVLGAIGNHPALDLALFDGDEHVHPFNPPTCGIPAEPALYLGPDSYAGQYVTWAMNYALSLGIPANRLSAEAIVGSFNLESKAARDAGASFDHLWSPIAVLKTIFDRVGIPENQRTYALSFYERHKCVDADQFGPPCTEEDPAPWAEETAQYIRSVTGPNARIVATEMGLLDPVPSDWSTEHALEHLYYVFEKYGMDGGCFWKWVPQNSDEQNDTTRARPVKVLGLDFVYNPPQKEIEDAGGFHAAIPNRSFEDGNATPDNWTIAGDGTGGRYFLAGETGQPEVPSRGQYSLRLTTGSGAADIYTATSDSIAITGNTAYTTTANLRFGWTGDPNPSADASVRPQVFVTFHYFDSQGNPSATRASDVFRFFQEDSTGGAFKTFPLQYTAPSDAASMKVEIGVSRNGLPTTISLDADNLR